MELVNERGFTNLTIAEITRTAELSRGTFYTYYLDKYDLLEKIESQLITTVQELMKMNIDKTVSWIDNVNNNNLSAELDSYSPYRSFIQSFDFLDKNRFILKTLLSKNGDPQFVYKLKGIVDERISSNYSDIFQSKHRVIPRDYTHALLISSLISIIGHWIEKENPETPSEMAEILIHSQIFTANK